MPTSGTIGTSFSGWQSQKGDTSSTRLTWKPGRSLTTAHAYSEIFLLRMSNASSCAACTASTGQTPMQRPQPTHLSWSICAFFPGKEIAPCAQFLKHMPQLTQRLRSTNGLPAECISILPRRGNRAHAEVLIAAADSGALSVP